jgi:CMP-2-keto-3-deoxyoctulosonic acid synthetase
MEIKRYTAQTRLPGKVLKEINGKSLPNYHAKEVRCSGKLLHYDK